MCQVYQICFEMIFMHRNTYSPQQEFSDYFKNINGLLSLLQTMKLDRNTDRYLPSFFVITKVSSKGKLSKRTHCGIAYWCKSRHTPVLSRIFQVTDECSMSSHAASEIFSLKINLQILKLTQTCVP